MTEDYIIEKMNELLDKRDALLELYLEERHVVSLLTALHSQRNHFINELRKNQHDIELNLAIQRVQHDMELLEPYAHKLNIKINQHINDKVDPEKKARFKFIPITEDLPKPGLTITP